MNVAHILVTAHQNTAISALIPLTFSWFAPDMRPKAQGYDF